MISNSVSSSESLITLMSFPTSSSININQVVSTAPCLVPTVEAALGGFTAEPNRRLLRAMSAEVDIAADGTERVGRQLKRTKRGLRRGAPPPGDELPPAPICSKSKSKSCSIKSERSPSYKLNKDLYN